MPEMAIPRNFQDSPATAFNVGHVLLSYMTYPNDETAREVFLKVSNQNIINELEKQSKITLGKIKGIPNNIVQSTYQEILDVNVKQHFILAENPQDFLLAINAQDEIGRFASPEIQKGWKTVASIVQTLLKMKKHTPDIRGGVSLKKATAFLEKCLKKELLPQKGHIHENSRDMLKAWAQFKSIAHLTLPFYKMYSEPRGTPCLNFFSQEGAKNFIIHSANIQELLLAFTPQHGHKSAILEPEELWLIPHYFQVPKITMKFDDATQEQLAILNSYRSGD